MTYLDFDLIKDSVDIVEVYDDYSPLGYSGQGGQVRCPKPEAHKNGDKIPSAHLYPHTNSWYCFRCEKGGSVIDLVMFITGMDFIEASRELINKYGLEINLDSETISHIKEKQEREKALQRFIDYCHNNLGEEQRAHLKERGLTDELIDMIKIGYEPLSDPEDRELAEKVGALTDKGYYIPSGSLIIPIHRYGTVIYWVSYNPDPDSGKYKHLNWLNEEQQAPSKYLKPNSKRLDQPLWGSEEIKNNESVYIVDGVFDKLCLQAVDLPSITTLGSNNLDGLEEKLQRKNAQLHILPDLSDKDGIETAEKIAKRVWPSKAKILNMPKGKDINDVCQEAYTPADFRKTVQNMSGKNILERKFELLENIEKDADRCDKAEEIEIYSLLADEDEINKNVHAQQLSEILGKGVTKTNVKNKVEEAIRKKSDLPTGDKKNTERLNDKLSGIEVPRDLKEPSGWSIRHDGVFKKSSEDKQITNAPVIISKHYIDAHENREYYRLIWKRRDKWCQEIVSTEKLVIRYKLEKLAEIGVPVTSNNTVDLIQYFTDFLKENRASMPFDNTSAKLGWVSSDYEKGFLYGKNHITPQTNITERGIEETDDKPQNGDSIKFQHEDRECRNFVKGMRSNGTYQVWSDAIEKIEPYERVKLAMYTALVPPLLDILGLPNFVFDISGRTSIGKTFTLKLCGSIWGNPIIEQEGSVIHTWYCTETWAERMSALISGIPLFLDDTKVAKYEYQVPNMIYEIVQGQGLGRGKVGGLRETSHWRTVLLSTGETAAVDFSEDGGTRTRVLTLSGSPLGGENHGRLVKDVQSSIEQNYGHVGPRFIKYIVKNLDNVDLWKEKVRQHEKRFLEIARDNAMKGRIATYLAVIELVAELSHNASLFPWEYESAVSPELQEELLTEAAEGDRSLDALEYTLSWAQSRKTQFWSRDTSGEPPCGGWLGKWENKGDLCIYREQLERVLNKKYDVSAIIKQWGENDFFVIQPSSVGYQKNIRIDGELSKIYCIKRSVINDIINCDGPTDSKSVEQEKDNLDKSATQNEPKEENEADNELSDFIVEIPPKEANEENLLETKEEDNEVFDNVQHILEGITV